MGSATLKKKLQKYEALLKLSRVLASETDVNTLLEIIMRETTDLLEADRSSLFFIDRNQGVLWSKIAQNAEISVIKVPVGKGIAGYVARTGKLLNIKDAYKDRRFYHKIDAKTGYKTKNIICVPVRNRSGQIIGVIESLNKKIPPYHFTSEDEEIISIIASLAAIAIENAKYRKELLDENRSLRDQLMQYREDEFVIGRNPQMQEVANLIHKVAPSNANVLIRGESGTGKEVVARLLHRLSPRKNGPFIKLSCAAIPETLLESELFGYEKGAFTGAITSKKGSFELADGGTLFLDEIADISPQVQVKLLRAIQEKEVQKLGSVNPVGVDVRIIAATNRDLEKMMKSGTFREDLYYRLNVITITLPPLRERKEDIPLLVEHIIKKFNVELNRKFEGIEKDALERLMNYDWPGNVRELENVIERAMVLGTEPLIREKDIGELIFSVSPLRDTSQMNAYPLREKVEMVEKEEIERTLKENNYNISQTAKKLNIKRTTLLYKIKKYHIQAHRKDSA